MSERAIASVWPGSPYIRSRFTLSKLSSATATARRASSAPWMRPRAASMRSSKLCTPTEMRFTPACLKPAKRAASTVPGFASSVISAPGSSGRRARTPESSVSIDSGEQARRAAADEYAANAPAPYRRKAALEIGNQSFNVLALGELTAALVRVEVAVRALAHAPGDVNVERERRQELQPDFPGLAKDDRIHSTAPKAWPAPVRGG